MTSRVALWDWAAMLQAHAKLCQRVQVTLTVAVSLLSISISLWKFIIWRLTVPLPVLVSQSLIKHGEILLCD